MMKGARRFCPNYYGAEFDHINGFLRHQTARFDGRSFTMSTS